MSFVYIYIYWQDKPLEMKHLFSRGSYELDAFDVLNHFLVS